MIATSLLTGMALSAVATSGAYPGATAWEMDCGGSWRWEEEAIWC